MNYVFHFSDSMRLPWTIKTGELRPNLNHLKGNVTVNYLWATCRLELLPLGSVLKVEAKGYRSSWTPLDISPQHLIQTDDDQICDDPMMKGFIIGDMAYYATAFELFDGSIGQWMPRCEQMAGRWEWEDG
jgi:hypothetical protein